MIFFDENGKRWRTIKRSAAGSATIISLPVVALGVAVLGYHPQWGSLSFPTTNNAPSSSDTSYPPLPPQPSRDSSADTQIFTRAQSTPTEPTTPAATQPTSTTSAPTPASTAPDITQTTVSASPSTATTNGNAYGLARKPTTR